MNCTQNCRQGRACDCRLDAEGYLPEDDTPPPMDRLSLLLLFLSGVLSGGVVTLVVFNIGRIIGGDA